MALPIVKVALPLALIGQPNGKLAPSLLEPVGVGTARCERTAARSFRAMFCHARALGHDPRNVGGYRTFLQQVDLFESRYVSVDKATWDATPASRRKVWPDAKSFGHDSVYFVKRKLPNGQYPATAATPGTSNHGLGLALDIGEELDGDPAPENISPSFVAFLVTTGAAYGLSAESQSEPWHWRYFSGDRIPERTLMFEAARQLPVLEQGASGENVKRLQTTLRKWTPKLATDGEFGPKTKAALVLGQTAAHLVPTGNTDPETWARLTLLAA